jgi:hypothetical protein
MPADRPERVRGAEWAAGNDANLLRLAYFIVVRNSRNNVDQAAGPVQESLLRHRMLSPLVEIPRYPFDFIEDLRPFFFHSTPAFIRLLVGQG